VAVGKLLDFDQQQFVHLLGTLQRVTKVAHVLVTPLQLRLQKS
jgi:hypothetical protein